MASLIVAIITLSSLSLVASSDLMNRCNFLTERPLVQYCSGLYPFELSVKYRDKMIDQGMPYAIYTIGNEYSQYFVSFRISELHACKKLLFTNDNPRVFSCGDTPNNPKNLTLLEASIFCFEFNLQLCDELVSICLEMAERHEKLVPSTFVAFHYTQQTLLKDTSAATAISDASSTYPIAIVMIVIKYLS